MFQLRQKSKYEILYCKSNNFGWRYLRYLFSQAICVKLILRKRKKNQKRLTGDKLESYGYKHIIFIYKQAFPITNNIIVMYILSIKLRFSFLRHRWPYPIVEIFFRPFGIIAPDPTIMNYLAFQSFDFGRTWWRCRAGQYMWFLHFY